MSNLAKYEQYKESDLKATIRALIKNWNGSFDELIKYGDRLVHEELAASLAEPLEFSALPVLQKLYPVAAWGAKDHVVLWVGKILNSDLVLEEDWEKRFESLVWTMLTHTDDHLLRNVAYAIRGYSWHFDFAVQVVQVLAARVGGHPEEDKAAEVFIRGMEKAGYAANRVKELHEIKDRVQGVRK